MLAHRSHNPAALVALALLIVSILGICPGLVSAQPPLDDPRPIIDAAIADLGQRLNRTLARGLNVQFGWTWQEFPDASLGCPQPGQVYAAVVTPGFIIELTVGSAVYDYRATQDGTLLFLCGLRDAQGTPQPLEQTPAATDAGNVTVIATSGPTVIPPLPTLTPAAPVLEPVSYDPALAYVGQDGNVYITALTEGPGTPLTGDANRRATQEFPFFAEDRDYGLLRWSPDGSRLLFVDQKDGTLYLAISGQTPVPVARGLESGMPAAWSPDGSEFVVAVPTDVTLEGGATMLQLQAFPADGGAPRYAGEFARTGCSSRIDDPTWALYQDETGPAGGQDVFRWTALGYVHSPGCGGQGLMLTGFDNLTVWEIGDVMRAAVAPDGTRAVAIRPGAEGVPAGLMLVDLATGQGAPLDIQGMEPEQIAWSADGTRVLFSVSGGEMTVSGSADSAVGAAMFPIWPLAARTRTLALWRVPAGGGETQLLTPDLQGYGIGVIAAGPGNDIVLFSVVGSSGPMIELINNGADAATASAAAPNVAIWFVELPGGFNELQVGGQPVFGAAYSALPAFTTDNAQADAQGVVCDGALPTRLSVGISARVLPAAAVNLREFANSQASRVDVIPAGASFSVVGGPVCDSGIMWWQVEYRGQRGWAAESLANSYLLSPQP